MKNILIFCILFLSICAQSQSVSQFDQLFQRGYSQKYVYGIADVATLGGGHTMLRFLPGDSTSVCAGHTTDSVRLAPNGYVDGRYKADSVTFDGTYTWIHLHSNEGLTHTFLDPYPDSNGIYQPLAIYAIFYKRVAPDLSVNETSAITVDSTKGFAIETHTPDDEYIGFYAGDISQTRPQDFGLNANGAGIIYNPNNHSLQPTGIEITSDGQNAGYVTMIGPSGYISISPNGISSNIDGTSSSGFSISDSRTTKKGIEYGNTNLDLRAYPNSLANIYSTKAIVHDSITGIRAGSGLVSGAITYDKMQSVAGHRLMGNPTGSSAAPSEIKLGPGLAFSNDTISATSSGPDGNGLYTGSGTIPDGTQATCEDEFNLKYASSGLPAMRVLGGSFIELFSPDNGSNIQVANGIITTNADQYYIQSGGGNSLIDETDSHLILGAGLNGDNSSRISLNPNGDGNIIEVHSATSGLPGLLYNDQTVDKFGIQYYGDNSDVLKTHERSIPDVGTVKSIINDSLSARGLGGIYSGSGEVANGTVATLGSGAINNNITGSVGKFRFGGPSYIEQNYMDGFSSFGIDVYDSDSGRASFIGVNDEDPTIIILQAYDPSGPNNNKFLVKPEETQVYGKIKIETTGPSSIKIHEGGQFSIDDIRSSPVGIVNASDYSTNALANDRALTDVGTVKKLSPRTLYDAYSDQQNSGTSATTLYDYTAPVNTLFEDGQKLTFSYAGTFNDVTATGALTLFGFGATIASTGSLTISSTGAFEIRGWIVRTGSTTARASVSILTPGTTIMSYTKETDITGIDFTDTNNITLQGQAGGAGGGSSDITGKMATINFVPKAQ